MASDASGYQWLPPAAILLSAAVIAQVGSHYVAAYLSAPKEIDAFLEAIDSTAAEKESYDLDVAKIQRLEDKLRLNRLLRDIQKGGEALREGVHLLLVREGEARGEGGSRMRISARLFWASKRVELQEKLRQLDLLKMRFLVVQMGVIAGLATEDVSMRKKMACAAAAAATQPPDLEKAEKVETAVSEPRPGFLPRSLTEGLKPVPPPLPPMRRLTTQAIGHQNTHRLGWHGVVQELKASPLLHKRRASLEMAMAAGA